MMCEEQGKRKQERGLVKSPESFDGIKCTADGNLHLVVSQPDVFFSGPQVVRLAHANYRAYLDTGLLRSPRRYLGKEMS